MIDFLLEQIRSNEFFQGGLILTILGSIVFYLRSIPIRIYNIVVERASFTVVFDSRDPLFGMFHSWANGQPWIKKKRSVRIVTNNRKDPPEVRMTFGYDRYYVKHEGTWFIITHSKDSGKDGGKDSSDMSSFFFLEQYSITCVYWKRGRILDLLNSVAGAFALSAQGEVPVYEWNWGSWYSESNQPKKSLSKLILRKGLKEEIVEDLGEFFESSAWYETVQMPYQRGYLFTGPAGTGKTTLAMCLASEFNMRLCTLDLSDIDSDTKLKKAFLQTPGRSILVVEDFDSFFKGRKNVRESSRVTFSGLLNAINGVVSNPGRVLILTTNNADSIDPALARIGRIDRRFHLDYVNADQAARLYTMFHPNEAETAKKFGECCDGKGISPADLTGHFQACRKNSRDIFDVDRLLEERNERRDLSQRIAVEAELELAEKKKKDKDDKDDEEKTAGDSNEG